MPGQHAHPALAVAREGAGTRRVVQGLVEIVAEVVDHPIEAALEGGSEDPAELVEVPGPRATGEVP